MAWFQLIRMTIIPVYGEIPAGTPLVGWVLQRDCTPFEVRSGPEPILCHLSTRARLSLWKFNLSSSSSSSSIIN